MSGSSQSPTHGTGAVANSDKAALADSFSLGELPDSFYEDPYPTYEALRSLDPVRWMHDGSFFLTRYRDLEEVYKNPVRFSSDKKTEFAPKYGVESLLFQHHTSSLVFSDPPLHTQVRRLIASVLSPRAVAKMEPALVSLVDRLLDGLQTGGSVDLVGDFAAVVPVEVIGNLFCVPCDERGSLRKWSLAILGALEPALSSRAREHGERAVAEFLDYLRQLVASRRRQPMDPNEDLLSRLIQGETTGEQLSEIELFHNCIFLLNAGHETTSNLIGNGLELLLRYPEQRQKLLANPGLIKTAIEEFLRFESSNQLGNRRAVENTVIGGTPIRAGTPITLCIGSANRDPDRFERAEEFRIDRSPNPHLAFGAGVHTCAGLTLARLEARIAVGGFLRRFPGFKAAGRAERARRARFRGFVSLPATLE